jgi:hypothetical protein
MRFRPDLGAAPQQQGNRFRVIRDCRIMQRRGTCFRVLRIDHGAALKQQLDESDVSAPGGVVQSRTA